MISKIFKLRVALMVTTVSCFGAFGSMASAQPAAVQSGGAEQVPSESADSAGQVQDIIVTAQRRSENLQKTSLSIQVLSADTIRKAGATQASDLNTLVPGVSIGAVGSTVQVTLRGVGDVTTNPLGDPAVAFNIDGIYVATTSSIGSAFFDVARVEALKGPQGTLYGRNASGGAVNLITVAPVIGETTGFVEAEGGNFGLKRISGAVNAPLTSTLAVRGAFQIIDRDGYLSTGESDQSSQAVRFRALWQPSSDVSLLLNFDTSHAGGRGDGYVLRPRQPGIGRWVSINDPRVQDQITAASFPGFAAFPGTSSIDNEFINTSAQLDADLGPATLTVVGAYRHANEDVTTFNGFQYDQENIADQYSVETRLSNSSDRLKWVLGAYFYDQKQDANTAVNASDLFFSQALTYKTTDRSYAAFGEATFSVTDRFRLIGGLRYTYEKKTILGSVFDDSAFAVNGPGSLIEPITGSEKSNSVTWKGGAEFDITDSNLLFATASKGFKAGGINQFGPPDNTYDPETLTAFQLGMRNRFFDNRLQVNLEGFYWEYRDKQEGVIGFSPRGNLTFLVRNLGSATLKGGSIDITARPTNNDTFRVFLEYNDARYTGTLFNGFQLPKAPKWTGSIAYDRRFELSGGASLTANVNGQFSSSYSLSTDFVPLQRNPQYGRLNAALTLESASKTWSLTGYVKNITNQDVYSTGNNQPFQPGLVALNIQAPRTYGARLRHQF